MPALTVKLGKTTQPVKAGISFYGLIDHSSTILSKKISTIEKNNNETI